MKNSIRTKLLILILIALIIPAFIIGAVSIYYTNRLTDEYAYQYVSLICEKKAADINSMFVPLENSVNYMSINALEDLSNPMNLADQIYYENYTDRMRSILWNTSHHVEGAVSVYYRLNPEICGPTSGLFMTREAIGTEMKSVTPTDILAYDESDTEHVGWYYQPINEGRPIWMLPYYNQNTDVYMISYVMPLFKMDMTVGVMGMDIDFNHITDQVKGIKVYESGYAYLTDQEGKIIYHPSLNIGDSFTIQNGWWNSKCELNNGMVLNITAPESEINASRNDLMKGIIIISLTMMVIFVIVTILITKKMAAPLQKLNQIANKISEGDYEVDFNFERPRDEIGELTVSFENTVARLKEYMAHINGLAYKDSLTGVRNRTAYDYQIEVLEDELSRDDNIDFGIAVFDVNNLKYINDNLGHEKGDALIKGACQMICRTFIHSAVFRIGGDEFAAIIRDTSDDEIEELFETFKKNMKETWLNKEQELRISVAYGYSKYNPDKDDKQVEPIFKRADEIMYENKKLMKKELSVGK